MIDLSAELQSAAETDVLGVAVIGADRTVQRKLGRMVEWLPALGADCCQCPVLIGMESELTALAEGQRDMIALSGVRGASPGLDHPLTAVVLWNKGRLHYVVIAQRDFAAQQMEALFGSERRARRLMEQQLEAASSELRLASLARTRLRLARDLHDTLVHSIMALLTQIRLTRHFLSTDPGRVADDLATAEQAALDGLTRARDTIARLRMPDELELTSDVEEMLSDFARQTGAELSVNIDDGARGGLIRLGVTIQRILGEALRNIEAHAKARRIQFRAVDQQSASGRRLVVEVSDDGCGFDPAIPRPGHFGLIGMVEFAELAGGECAVESSLGKGTLVRISLPVTAARAAQPIGLVSDAGMAGSSRR